jgi:hypothetical protein
VLIDVDMPDDPELRRSGNGIAKENVARFRLPGFPDVGQDSSMKKLVG